MRPVILRYRARALAARIRAHLDVWLEEVRACEESPPHDGPSCREAPGPSRQGSARRRSSMKPDPLGLPLTDLSQADDHSRSHVPNGNPHSKTPSRVRITTPRHEMEVDVSSEFRGRART